VMKELNRLTTIPKLVPFAVQIAFGGVFLSNRLIGFSNHKWLHGSSEIAERIPYFFAQPPKRHPGSDRPLNSHLP